MMGVNLLTTPWFRRKPECKYTFARMVALRVTRKRVLDCTIGIIGPKGIGKSTTSLFLAHNIAKELVKIRGGKIEDYFNINHARTVDQEGTQELFENVKENGVYILDDVSVAWGSRNFMTTANKRLNNILTVMRIYRAVLILNMPDLAFIDKVPRTLADFFIEILGIDMETNRTFMRLLKFERSMMSDSTYKKYLVFDKKRVTRWTAGLPPVKLRHEYKKLREKYTQELMKKTIQEEQAEVSKEKIDRRKKNLDQMITEKGMALKVLVDRNATLDQISSELGVSYTTIPKLLKAMGLNRKRVKKGMASHG